MTIVDINTSNNDEVGIRVDGVCIEEGLFSVRVDRCSAWELKRTGFGAASTPLQAAGGRRDPQSVDRNGCCGWFRGLLPAGSGTQRTNMHSALNFDGRMISLSFGDGSKMERCREDDSSDAQAEVR